MALQGKPQILLHDVAEGFGVFAGGLAAERNGIVQTVEQNGRAEGRFHDLGSTQLQKPVCKIGLLRNGDDRQIRQSREMLRQQCRQLRILWLTMM